MILGLKHITKQDLIALVGYASLFGLVYSVFYLACGAPFEYGGEVFTTVVIWLAAQIGGLLFQLIKLPSLLGMLLSGMVLQSALPGLVSGLPTPWSEAYRALALGTIFLRSGLELDLKVFRRVGPVATRLLLIPGLVEAATDAGMAMAVFAMPVFYAFTLGFILKAVGPAIVIQTMFELQKSGLGVAKGIPSTVVAAASFDDMVAITGYSLFSNLAVRDPNKNFVYQMFHGPLDIVLGSAAGLLGAMFCSATKVWNTKVKRALVVFATAQGLLFFLYEFGFQAGGALSALVLGLAVNVLWEQGRNVPFLKRVPGYMSLGPSENYRHEVEHVVGLFWRIFAQPLLFGIIGTLMNFRAPGFEASYIPKALAIIAVGLAVRVPTTFMVMAGAGLTLRERLFVALAWTPKATVQAALGALPLSTIKSVYGEDSPDVIIGDQILTTSIFAILICAPLGVLAINLSKNHLLDKMEVSIPVPQAPPSARVSTAVQTDNDITGSGEGGVYCPPTLPQPAAAVPARAGAIVLPPGTSATASGANRTKGEDGESAVAGDGAEGGGGEAGGRNRDTVDMKPEDRVRARMLEDRLERRRRRDADRATAKQAAEEEEDRQGAGTNGAGASNIGSQPGQQQQQNRPPRTAPAGATADLPASGGGGGSALPSDSDPTVAAGAAAVEGNSSSASAVQDAYEDALLVDLDCVMAQYLRSIEGLADAVGRGQMSTEQAQEYAVTLRGNVRRLRKKLLESRGLGASEDSETASTFFRLADRLMVTGLTTTGATSGAAAAAAVPAGAPQQQHGEADGGGGGDAVELTQVSVARAV